MFYNNTVNVTDLSLNLFSKPALCTFKARSSGVRLTNCIIIIIIIITRAHSSYCSLTFFFKSLLHIRFMGACIRV